MADEQIKPLIQLRADDLGFLLGDRLELTQDRERLELLRAIKADTAAMRQALGQGVKGGVAARPGAAEQLQQQTLPASPALASVKRAEPTQAAAVRELQGINQALDGISEQLAQPEGKQAPVLRVVPTVAPPTPVVSARPQAAAPVAVATPAKAAAPVAANRQRDDRGRFIPKAQREAMRKAGGDQQASEEHDAHEQDAKDERRQRRTEGVMTRLTGALARLRGGLTGAGSGAEQLDPTLAAMHEARGLAAPITGTLGRLFGSRRGTEAEQIERKVNVPWYRRLYGELHEINKKTERQSLLSRLGGLLTKLPLLGPLLGLLGGLLKRMGLMSLAGAAMRGLGSALGGRGRRGGRAGRAGATARTPRTWRERRERDRRARALRRQRRGRDLTRKGERREEARKARVATARETERTLQAEQRTAREAKGASSGKTAPSGGGLWGSLKKRGGSLLGPLRRIPVLGTLIGLAMAGGSLAGLGDQTREEKFNTVGSVAGSGIGGALGGLFGGPVGAVLGAALGDKIGGMVGDWLATVDWEKVGDQITGAWDGAVAAVKDGWAWCQDKFGGVIDTLGEWAGKAGDWVKEKTAQARETLQKAGEFVTEKAGQARDAVMQNETVQKGVKAAGEVVDKVKEKAAPVVEAAGDKLSEVKDAAVVAGGRLAGRLDKSFRHKESFEGVKGGDNLARYGRYTNDEAERIRQLKASGANTGGSTPGGLSIENRNKIIASAKAHGQDPQAMLEIAALESGGNPNAISSTGAIGLYQHTGGTASGVGITDRFDVDQNIEGAMRLAQENSAALQKAGLPVTRDNLYMMHQLGPVAAKEIIRGAAQGKSMDQLSQGTQNAAGFNVGKGSKTAAQYLATNSQALDTRLGKVTTADPVGVKPMPAAATNPAASARSPATASVVPRALPSDASKTPSVQVKVASNGGDRKDPPVVINQPLTQNVADRGLAHAATGGIGMDGRRP
jgi:hypothetical protein